RLDDDLVRADSVHLVVKTLALAIELAFDFQCRKAIGNDAQGPGAARAIDVHLVWRLVLVARAERAERGAARRRRLMRILERPAGPLRRDDDPAPDDRILA